MNYGPNKKVKVFNPNGYLLPLKRNVEGLPSNFYTRSHNDLKLLANSLLIGAIPLTDYATYQALRCLVELGQYFGAG